MITTEKIDETWDQRSGVSPEDISIAAAHSKVFSHVLGEYLSALFEGNPPPVPVNILACLIVGLDIGYQIGVKERMEELFKVSQVS